MGTEELTLSKNNQHSDYRLVNPLDALKQGAWVPGAFTPELRKFSPHKKNLTHHFK